MTKFNQDAFGQTVRVDFNQDISAATSYQMELRPEQGDTKTKTATLGTSAVTVDDSTYSADQYIEYILLDGDLDEYAGRWQKRGRAVMSSTNEIFTDWELFRVME